MRLMVKVDKLLARIEALETALRALVAVSPFSLAQDGRYCHCCGQSEWHREEHTPDCPWLAARRLVGEGEGTCCT
jgi:hypothetical protein